MGLPLLCLLLLIPVVASGPTSSDEQKPPAPEPDLICAAAICTRDEVYEAIGSHHNLSAIVEIFKEEAAKINVTMRAHLGRYQYIQRNMLQTYDELSDMREEPDVFGIVFNSTDEVLPYMAKHNPKMLAAADRRIAFVHENSKNLDTAAKQFLKNLGQAMLKFVVYYTRIPPGTKEGKVRFPMEFRDYVKTNLVDFFNNMPTSSRNDLEKTFCVQTIYRIDFQDESSKRLFNTEAD